MTFPGGTHDLWIRYWLAAGGIDPDRDVSTIVVPPPQMVANMKVGNMDAFCVGEPWNEQLVNQDIGFTALTTGELWFKHPEKILGMRADWVDANPKAARAIADGAMEAQQWCEKMENKQEMAEIVGRRQWFNVPVPDIIGRIKGDINYGHGRVAQGTNLLMKFWGKTARSPIPGRASTPGSSPRTSAGASSSRRIDVKALVDRANRSDLWIEAAKALGRRRTSRPRQPRHRDVLRRQGVRSRRHAGLPEVAVDQARRRSEPKPPSPSLRHGDSRMNMPMLKAEAAAAVSVRGAPAAGGQLQDPELRLRRPHPAGVVHGWRRACCRRW